MKLNSIITYLSLALLPMSGSTQPVPLAKTPLFITQAPPPLTLLVMGRDHKLYYEAYNDATDLNQDDQLDIKYNPNIDYYGYFDSYKCYVYKNNRFNPKYWTTDKTCNGLWSGDFLNYLTTSRMDALRKVLYGGYRVKDSKKTTILERAYIPQDAHSWGKSYTSTAVDGYDIRDYTPLTLPTSQRRHLFANTTLLYSDGSPLLRVALNQPYQIWEWLSIERPVAGDRVQHGEHGPSIAHAIDDYQVRVRVCVPYLLESNCQRYANNIYKPTGLLQQFGANQQMKFGLLTGSYSKNLSGGVLRKNIEFIDDEINPQTGQWTNTTGIIGTIDRLRITGFGNNYSYNQNCGFIFNRSMQEGECRMWGNPVGEMIYESIRYFAGKHHPTAAFDYTGGDDATLGLPKPTWQDPYQQDNNPWCAKASLIVISDSYPSYDSDQVPGSTFNTFSTDLTPAPQASQLGQTIWQQEFNNQSLLHFIGQAGQQSDGTPSPKLVSSFGNIRGLSPEEPNKEGSYYAASMAYYAKNHDLHPALNQQSLTSYAIALSSPLPEIHIPINNQIITLIPFGKSVSSIDNCLGGIDPTKGAYQPTNSIVDFYVETIDDKSGTFRINFEDTQQGADHDMDAIVKYHYQVNEDNSVTINLESIYAAGCIVQHLGYIISGTTEDGIYLEVRDLDTQASQDVNYFLDTPPNQPPNGQWQTGQALPLKASRNFKPGQTSSATILNNPLWYVAKWGGFTDQNESQTPDQVEEFDQNRDGIPDNYFLVTNTLYLKKRLQQAFEQIIKRNASASAVSIGQITNNHTVYQATFNSKDWSGQLFAYNLNLQDYTIDYNGSGPDGSKWEASYLLDTIDPLTERQILTMNPTTKQGIAFRWPENLQNPSANELTTEQIEALQRNPQTDQIDQQGYHRYAYIRGLRAKEQQYGGTWRDRSSSLGDIVHSQPILVSNQLQDLPDYWPAGAPENNYRYSNFYQYIQNRPTLIYVGANDGMLHAFDAQHGQERMAYIPTAVFEHLNQLTDPQYNHEYYVDGAIAISDALLSSQWQTVLVGSLGAGGQGLYALNITNPSTFSEQQAKQIVLWEFTKLDDADLGYTFGKPVIARLANHRWGVIVSNGYNNTESTVNPSTNGNAVLYVLDLETGAIIKKFDTEVGSDQDPQQQQRPNGMSAPVVIDSNGDYIADFIYAGDLFGHVWKMDISNPDPEQWQFALQYNNQPQALFHATDPDGHYQPITAAPMVARAKQGFNQWYVYVGTGQFITTVDKTDTQIQTIYGLIDNNQPIADRSDLLQQFILGQTQVFSQNYRFTSDYTLQTSHRGWFLDLMLDKQVTGERITQQVSTRDQKIIFTTIIPSTDPCEEGGSGWLMELDQFTGQRLQQSPFDVNGDGIFNELDLLVYDNSKQPIPASGIQSTVSLPTFPAIINDLTKEYKFLSGSNGKIQKITENPLHTLGRKSWQQLR